MIFYEKISTFKRPECRLFHINTTFQKKVSRIFVTVLHRANEFPTETIYTKIVFFLPKAILTDIDTYFVIARNIQVF